jgi:hypothetical protein
MQVLIYAPPSDMEKQLWKKIRRLVNGKQYSLFYRVSDLASYLKQPKGDKGVCIFQASEEVELIDLAAIKPLLDDYGLILVLPGQSERMTCLGHALHPRFIDYADGDLEHLQAVLKKLFAWTSSRNSV